MASLLDKINTLISANLHAMVDKALQSNSVAVMDEYIRQAEDNLDKLEDATATVGGEVKTLKRKSDEYAAQAAKLDHDIDALLQQGREDLAAAAQSKFNTTQHMAEQYKEQYERQQAEYKTLLDAKLKLEAKLTTTKEQREQMLALLDLAKSKELTFKTMKSIDDIVGSGDADIARIGESIQARLDKASAKSEMMSSRLDDQIDEVLGKNELDSQLAERKKRLGMTN
ncbi:MAG TPA: PspA/IM30 family protein [Anaerolineae bacterium]|nr:PspA/IM30 family protein [Anaerolineae bacterium]